MALTPEELAAARAWIGTEETDQALEARYERLGSLDAAVEECLRQQYTELLETPGNLSLPSGLSVTFQANMQGLEKLLKEFKASGGIEASLAGTQGTVPGVTKLHRADRR
jgi:hypothetical protein